MYPFVPQSNFLAIFENKEEKTDKQINKSLLLVYIK